MAHYRVMARKYRPRTLAELIGQEALVRTLTNAIDSGRIAHAFLFTGIRGVGKTTTARIIARSLNCVNGPTIDPCGTCEHCVAIAEDRHMDVLEMDAASRTGVNDIRELIETVQYAPVSARYKVYIIDEVHMLSTSAFNALLKTLEEPPPHVKFVFATTEIRKIPVTILSRCQRFDLKRVGAEALAAHLANICGLESVTCEAEALALIARMAEGSVRDSLSLLDQAVALSGGAVTAEQVRGMLGISDRGRVYDLLESLAGADLPQTLQQARAMVADGADPVLILQDLLEVVGFITQVQIAPALAEDITHPEAERLRAADLARKLDVAALARMWQLLLKGLSECRLAPNALAALEMLLVRIGYLATLPPLDLLVREGQSQPDGGGEAPAPRAAAPTQAPMQAAPVQAVPIQTAPQPAAPQPAATPPAADSEPPVWEDEPGASEPAAPSMDGTAEAPVGEDAPSAPAAAPERFEDVVALFAARKEVRLLHHLKQDVRLQHFEPGAIRFVQNPHLPPDFAARVAACLKAWTATPWEVGFGEGEGTASIAEQQHAEQEQQRQEAIGHPLVQEALTLFEGAQVTAVKL